MAKLTQDTRGTYGARKRLPDDVREDYGRLYGARYEAKFSAPAKTPRTVATQLYGEWLSEIEGRFAAIRSQRKGEGVSLTPRQARALAGEWYDWFVARHPVSDQQKWEDLRDKVHEVLRDAIGDQEWERNNPDDLWRDNEDLRKAVRPVLADVGETAQFLGMKGIALDNEARARFLDHLYEDLSAAFKRLIGISKGDYSPDEYRRRFPKFEVSDNGQPPLQLFETWVKERKPALSSIETWRYVFRAMEDHFKDRSASSITPDEAQQWIRGLVTEARSARTVRKNWLTAAKTIFGWAAKEKRVRYNPFQSVTLTIPKRIRLRETQAFLDDERKLILKSALMITDTESPDNAARRWVPWLCAYTGARSGEITQLRGSDVINRNGIPAIRITPDAGTVKGGKARVVPLHEHLIAQGFLDFVAKRGTGPLFYKQKGGRSPDVSGQPKPRYVQARQRLAAWVRSLGISDPELQPNHAWRHTFKQIAARAGISVKVSDEITGHAHRSVANEYAASIVEDMAEQLKKFPRYSVE